MCNNLTRLDGIIWPFSRYLFRLPHYLPWSLSLSIFISLLKDILKAEFFSDHEWKYHFIGPVFWRENQWKIIFTLSQKILPLVKLLGIKKWTTIDFKEGWQPPRMDSQTLLFLSRRIDLQALTSMDILIKRFFLFFHSDVPRGKLTSIWGRIRKEKKIAKQIEHFC